MHYVYRDTRLGGLFHFLVHPTALAGTFEPTDRLLTIAWNTGPSQIVHVDGVDYTFETQLVLLLMINQTFQFERPESLIVWQFNREFYCIIDHDKEISCVGFLFYGSDGLLFLKLDQTEQRRFEALCQVFADEFVTHDTIQAEMLRMLLKRLIIKATRIGKEQYGVATVAEAELDLVRQFNLLVELHYRAKHSVAEYADLLNRSPKTLTNLFAGYN